MLWFKFIFGSKIFKANFYFPLFQIMMKDNKQKELKIQLVWKILNHNIYN